MSAAATAENERLQLQLDGLVEQLSRQTRQLRIAQEGTQLLKNEVRRQSGVLL